MGIRDMCPKHIYKLGVPSMSKLGIAFMNAPTVYIRSAQVGKKSARERESSIVVAVGVVLGGLTDTDINVSDIAMARCLCH